MLLGGFGKKYIEGYRECTGEYPLLYIIGVDVELEALKYSKNLIEERKLEFKRFKCKPLVLVRNYQQLMEFLDEKLGRTEIDSFDLDRLKRDVPLLYEGHPALHEGQDG